MMMMMMMMTKQYGFVICFQQKLNLEQQFNEVVFKKVGR